MEKENNTTALHLERNQPDPTLLENEPLLAHARHFPLTGTASRGIKEGGADIFLDHSGSTYIIPKLSLYSTGLMPPKVILIRSSLYQ